MLTLKRILATMGIIEAGIVVVEEEYKKNCKG